MSDSTSSSNRTQAFSMEDFENALQQYDYEFVKGQKVKGTVVQITSDGAYVDIGGKSPGFVPTNEAALGFVNDLENILPIGESKEFLIIREKDSDGQVTLSLRQLALDQAWADIKEMAESGKSTQIRITGANKGGVTGEVAGLRAFIPRSHLQQRDNLESMVGQLLTATFLEVNQENRKLVLSQRDAMRAVTMNSITEGALMAGRVVNMKPYGAFIDLQGATGLLHIKEISGARVESLEKVLEVGQEIKVIVKQIDEYQNRMSLSIKALEEYPGENIEKLKQVMANAEERWGKVQNSSRRVIPVEPLTTNISNYEEFRIVLHNDLVNDETIVLHEEDLFGLIVENKDTFKNFNISQEENKYLNKYMLVSDLGDSAEKGSNKAQEYLKQLLYFDFPNGSNWDSENFKAVSCAAREIHRIFPRKDAISLFLDVLKHGNDAARIIACYRGIYIVDKSFVSPMKKIADSQDEEPFLRDYAKKSLISLQYKLEAKLKEVDLEDKLSKMKSFKI